MVFLKRPKGFVTKFLQDDGPQSNRNPLPTGSHTKEEIPKPSALTSLKSLHQDKIKVLRHDKTSKRESNLVMCLNSSQQNLYNKKNEVLEEMLTHDIVKGTNSQNHSTVDVDKLIDLVIQQTEGMNPEDLHTIYLADFIESIDLATSADLDGLEETKTKCDESFNILIDEVLDNVSIRDANELYNFYLKDTNVDDDYRYIDEFIEWKKLKKMKTKDNNQVKNHEEKELLISYYNNKLSKVTERQLNESSSLEDKNVADLYHAQPEPNTSFGVWVECVRCLKWRILEGILDPSDLDDDWHCGQQKKYSTANCPLVAPCDEPEVPSAGNPNNIQYIYSGFTIGSLVFAKLTGFPEWPSMIDCDADGRFAEYSSDTGEVKRYRVVFFDHKQMTTQLIPARNIRRYSNKKQLKLDKRHEKFRCRLEAAINEAEKAIKMTLEERIFAYGYPYPERKSLKSEK